MLRGLLCCTQPACSDAPDAPRQAEHPPARSPVPLQQPPGQPACGLSADLWRAILLAARGTLPPRLDAFGRVASDTSDSRTQQPRLDADGWAQWCRLVSTVASVCRSLRAAVLGPDAGLLWAEMSLRSTYPGLSQGASPGLNRLAAGQGRHATTVRLCCSEWAPEELQRIAGSLTSPALGITLQEVCTYQTAASIGRGLSVCAPRSVAIEGSIPVALPVSVRHFEIGRTVSMPWKPDEVPSQKLAVQTFACLEALPCLQTLDLCLTRWQLTPELAASLGKHSHLVELRLSHTADRSFGQYAVQRLPQVPRLSLELTVRDGSITQVLAGLKDVQLFCLSLYQVPSTLTAKPYDLGAQDEYHLSRCSISQQLTLCLAYNRRLRLPPHFKVVYEI